MERSEISDSLMREMRSSAIFLGAILARCGQADLSYPGGCELGPRPIDLHLSGLRDLGAEISEDGGMLHCRAAGMPPTRKLPLQTHLRLPTMCCARRCSLSPI